MTKSFSSAGDDSDHTFQFSSPLSKPVVTSVLPINSKLLKISKAYLNENKTTLASGLTTTAAQSFIPNKTRRRVIDIESCLQMKSPVHWNPDKPHVYTLVISLRKGGHIREVLQAESCRVGFRAVHIISGLLRVDRTPITIRGTNLHEHGKFDSSSFIFIFIFISFLLSSILISAVL